MADVTCCTAWALPRQQCIPDLPFLASWPVPRCFHYLSTPNYSIHHPTNAVRNLPSNELTLSFCIKNFNSSQQLWKVWFSMWSLTQPGNENPCFPSYTLRDSLCLALLSQFFASCILSSQCSGCSEASLPSRVMVGQLPCLTEPHLLILTVHLMCHRSQPTLFPTLNAYHWS